MNLNMLFSNAVMYERINKMTFENIKTVILLDFLLTIWEIKKNLYGHKDDIIQS